MYRILDLDNCISDDGWRIPFINWQKNGDSRYDHYHQLAPWDSSSNRDLLATGFEIIVLTGRPIFFRPATEFWLHEHRVKFRHLIMRNPEDRSSAVDLKSKMLGWLVDMYDVPLPSIADAYDDRLEIVEMYRAHGIAAQQRAIHNVNAYASPCGNVVAP